MTGIRGVGYPDRLFGETRVCRSQHPSKGAPSGLKRSLRLPIGIDTTGYLSLCEHPAHDSGKHWGTKHPGRPTRWLADSSEYPISVSIRLGRDGLT